MELLPPEPAEEPAANQGPNHAPHHGMRAVPGGGGVVTGYVRVPMPVSNPLLVSVSVTVPVTVGVIAKVCAAELFAHVSTMGVLSPPPLGVIVMVPV